MSGSAAVNVTGDRAPHGAGGLGGGVGGLRVAPQHLVYGMGKAKLSQPAARVGNDKGRIGPCGAGLGHSREFSSAPRLGFGRGVSVRDSPSPDPLGGGGHPSALAPSLAKAQSDSKPQFRARDRRGGCRSPWETPVTQGTFAPASAPSSFLAAGSGHCGEKPSPVHRVCGKARGETEARHCGVERRRV